MFEPAQKNPKTSSLYFQPCQTAVNASFISGHHSHNTASAAASSLSDSPSPTPFHQELWNLRGPSRQPTTCLSQTQTRGQELEAMLVQTAVNSIGPNFSSPLPLPLRDASLTSDTSHCTNTGGKPTLDVYNTTYNFNCNLRYQATLNLTASFCEMLLSSLIMHLTRLRVNDIGFESWIQSCHSVKLFYNSCTRWATFTPTNDECHLRTRSSYITARIHSMHFVFLYTQGKRHRAGDCVRFLDYVNNITALLFLLGQIYPQSE